MNNKVKVLSIGFIAIVIAVGGWFALKPAAPKTENVAVRELETTIPTQWELAEKLTGRDILAEEGVKREPVTTIQTTGGTTALQALLANNIDVSSSSAWPPFLNIVARGGKIKALIGTAVSRQDNECGQSSVHTIKDLVGKRIAVNVLGAEADYVIRLYLKKNGLSISQVELVVVPEEKEEQMLRTRQVDAIAFSTTGGIFFDLTAANGGVRKIPGTSNFETKGETMLSGIGFRSDFIEKHPDTVRRFVHAYVSSRRIIWDAFQKDPERVRKAFAEICVKKGSNPRLAKFFRTTLWTPEHQLIADKDIQWWLDRFIEDGLLKPGQIKPSDIYSNEFYPVFKK